MNIKKTLVTAALTIGLSFTGFATTEEKAYADNFHAANLYYETYQKFTPYVEEFGTLEELKESNIVFYALYYDKEIQSHYDRANNYKNLLYPNKTEKERGAVFINANSYLSGKKTFVQSGIYDFINKDYDKIVELGFKKIKVKDGEEFLFALERGNKGTKFIGFKKLPKGTVTKEDEYIEDVKENIKNLADKYEKTYKERNGIK